MPSKKDDKGHKNLTFRLPDEYHRQLTSQAERSGLTMNAHLLNIVRGHLMNSGYFPDVIKSASGRLFEIVVTEIPQDKHSSRLFCSRFDINEYHPLYSRLRASYIFGVACQIASGNDPYGIVRDIGIALLNFYNRQRLEIDQLAWQQTISEPLPPTQNRDDNWRYIGSETTRNPAEFLIALGRNHWKDQLLITTGQSQDMRYKLRTEADLYVSERRPNVTSRQTDFERYGYETAESWINEHGNEELTEKYVDDKYNDLPRYVQKQIDSSQYFEIVLRCLAQLLKQPE